mgnify:CR=1 FL=1
MPMEYLADFVRGYFDGDGSVFYVRYLSTKDKKQRNELRSSFTCGSRDFLQELMSVLNERLGLHSKKLKGYGITGNSWKLGYGTKDTLKLLEFMYYPDCALALKRKEKYYTRRIH